MKIKTLLSTAAYYTLLLASISIVFSSCNNDDDAPPVVEVNEEPTDTDPTEESKSRTDYPVQDFMWQAMNTYYFWQEDVTNLGDERFDSLDEYVTFLASETDPETFFYSICNNHSGLVGDVAAVDRFSFAAENYKDLVNSLQGVSKSNGLEFRLFASSNSDDVYGVVIYVAEGSDAAGEDIGRGDAFIAVDGQRLTRANFRTLLFGENDTYTLSLADITGENITENDREITLTKAENFSENPILVSKVIETNGIKVGYLMYNSFLAAYDEALNTAFGSFKTQGVTELVLDFRYNGGGRVSSAVQIASAVYGTNTSDLFLKARYNSKLQASLSAGQGESNFIATTIAGSPINSLNLSTVYVITTGATASASELVINGLAPYVRVVQIGEATVGKNEFSLTFVDDPDNSFVYNENREANINPNNSWGIQPLLGRNENNDGFSDYTGGLLPDFEQNETPDNLGILGNPDEPLLAIALDQINGTSGKTAFRNASLMPAAFMTSSEYKPNYGTANMDGMLEMRKNTSASKKFEE